MVVRGKVVLGALACLLLATGCAQNVDRLNSSAEQAVSYDNAAALFQAIDSGGVEALAFNDKGETPGPAGIVMYSSGDVLLDSGQVALMVFPPGIADSGSRDEYAAAYLDSAADMGVEDAAALLGPNWAATGTLDSLADIQAAVGGELRQ